MQLIGNKKARDQFKSYFSHYQSNSKPVFFVVVWPEWIGKTLFLRSIAQELLWEYLKTDFFWMRDLSNKLWKTHAIQIETPTSLKTIPLDGTTSYENKGIREINGWLQQSSLSWKKILLIENLQRMINAAMNAFLKTCEEPLANRYLFATAEHESWILPTILSRAMVIRFSSLSNDEIKNYLSDTLSYSWQEKEQELLIKLSLGKPWILHQLLQQKKENPELFNDIISLFDLMKEQGNFTKKLQLFKKLDGYWILESFITMLIKEKSENEGSDSVEEWIKIKQLLASNITQENALRYGILSHV